MELKAHLKDYRTELIQVIFIALILVILVLALNTVFDLSSNEAFILDLSVTFLGLFISVALILRKIFELTFRPIDRILTGIDEIKNKLANNPIPPKLSPALARLLNKEKKTYDETYDVLTKGGRYLVQKEEMYQNLIKFALVMDAEESNEILAISSVDIPDLPKDPWAKSYLDINEKCVERGVPVKRIFLLSDPNIRNGDFVWLIKTHGEKISDGQLSEVRWIDKRLLNEEERNLDLAIFNGCILVEQKLSCEYQIIIDEQNEINVAKKRFYQIWNNPNCKSWEIIEDERRRRTGK